MKNTTKQSIGKAVAGPLIFMLMCSVILVIYGLIKSFK